MRMLVLLALNLEGSEPSESKVSLGLLHSYILRLFHSYTLLSSSKSPMAFTKAVPFERSSLMR